MCKFCNNQLGAESKDFNLSNPNQILESGPCDCDTERLSGDWLCECKISWPACEVHKHSPEWMRWRRNEDVNTFRRKPEPIVEKVGIGTSKKVLAKTATNISSVRNNRFLKAGKDRQPMVRFTPKELRAISVKYNPKWFNRIKLRFKHLA